MSEAAADAAARKVDKKNQVTFKNWASFSVFISK